MHTQLVLCVQYLYCSVVERGLFYYSRYLRGHTMTLQNLSDTHANFYSFNMKCRRLGNDDAYLNRALGEAGPSGTGN